MTRPPTAQSESLQDLVCIPSSTTAMNLDAKSFKQRVNDPSAVSRSLLIKQRSGQGRQGNKKGGNETGGRVGVLGKGQSGNRSNRCFIDATESTNRTEEEEAYDADDERDDQLVDASRNGNKKKKRLNRSLVNDKEYNGRKEGYDADNEGDGGPVDATAIWVEYGDGEDE